MERQHLREDRRARSHGMHGRKAKRRVIAERQQQLRHPLRPPRNALVLRLVFRQIPVFHCCRQSPRLMKREAEPFTGDRIHRSGRIANQRDTVAMNGAQPA
jgi:hypothetical protein